VTTIRDLIKDAVVAAAAEGERARGENTEIDPLTLEDIVEEVVTEIKERIVG
jgi:hypothetical protein